MLTQICRIVCDDRESSETQKVALFEVGYSNLITRFIPGGSLYWQPIDIECFQLVASETVKIGQPVNREDALYWIEQVKARALGEDELIGWVKVS